VDDLTPEGPRVLATSLRYVEAGARDPTTAQSSHFLSGRRPLLPFALRRGGTASARNVVKGLASEIICLTIQTAAKFDCRANRAEP
jgi:hypothetical protein